MRKTKAKDFSAFTEMVDAMLQPRKLVEGCRDCEKIRMKPVKAFAVVRGNRLQGHAAGNMEVILVMPSKKIAKKYWRRGLDRIARVEIREVES